ncbi:hypothetical protein B0H67DRAFT_550322 [Lasiosphaeris hirsuta]|uniref:Uncharacterized protein n=1 Tax=Lasiosphaeris hirsuta TaxID=260670 RepID=A0AA40AZ01_9PEZI|nr:hypothetical protein B0H67DRAFT_550322 [Lasiosphaeris hirsuta]
MCPDLLRRPLRRRSRGRYRKSAEEATLLTQASAEESTPVNQAEALLGLKGGHRETEHMLTNEAYLDALGQLVTSPFLARWLGREYDPQQCWIGNLRTLAGYPMLSDVNPRSTFRLYDAGAESMSRFLARSGCPLSVDRKAVYRLETVATVGGASCAFPWSLATLEAAPRFSLVEKAAAECPEVMILVRVRNVYSNMSLSLHVNP